ncbi:MAG: hypothetical protein GEU98_08280 [Pseudonocardiaceae bacterium]|nr:hypothetical protein [Pseudonocardiaceae bacterium]
MPADSADEDQADQPTQRNWYSAPRVEPFAALDWYTAVELPDSLAMPLNPAQRRRAWIHRAPESRVLSRYRESGGLDSELPAPWWLRALAAGELSSRAGGFAVEDAVTELLDARGNWEYVPWVGDAESGYWEFVPSEMAAGPGTVPTTILLTHRHPGWIDVVPAHSTRTPKPVAMNLGELRNRIAEVEAMVVPPDGA